MQCRIQGITHNGEGVARIEGKATFIPFAIPGETVEVEIMEKKKNYNRARLLEVIESSPHRKEPLCPHYYECGGCSYQHVAYDYQLKLKREVVQNNISRIGKLDVTVNPVIASPQEYRYRNKVTWHFDNGRLGYYQAGTNNLLEIRTCKLISEKMEQVTNSIKEYMPELPLTQNSNLIVRESSPNNEIMVVVTNLGKKIHKSLVKKMADQIDSLIVTYQGKNGYETIWGNDKLIEQVNKVNISLSPGAFFQVNHQQMERIIAILQDYLDLKKDETLLDAYCGAGSIALALASKVKEVVGIENYSPAIDDAILNARENALPNYEFIAGACETILPKLNKRFDKVIVDPPRSGLKKEVIEAIAKVNPKKIAYVSCNPATLARDLAIFKELNYQIKELQPLDMFPQTMHVETVVLLSHKNSR
ncbi:MAG: 23S rRNA (uracil(1939)-C(5))-methyltransferase RlmD [Syntrophomonadaceae bacterium]|nr:23S rRNA (uracil(1939)-C(5))-methyltransferase RlmD [Syntrophomonadaceae bacterium]